MKKILTIICCLLFTFAGIFGYGCTGSSKNGNNDKIQVVTTIFPAYDWVMSVLGDNAQNAEVTMLLDNGVDLHSYQPTAEDIINIADCDLFIYVGGESDGWVDDALKENENKDRVVINLLEVLGDSVKEEEIVEGMEHDHDHAHEHEEGEEHEHEDGEEHDHEDGEEHEHEDGEEHEHEDGEEHDHEDGEEHDHEDGEEHDHEDGEEHEHEGHEYDEHVWLSLRNASVLVNEISASLQYIDPENAETYKKNAEEYTAKLKTLDSEYEEAVSQASCKTVLFGDRFPFRYMTDDYGLEYYAAFAGCSAESEASFETVVFLAKKVDELDLHTVLTIEGKDKSIAETIVDNTQNKDQQILTLDSMQSVTSSDVANGATYLSIMESNLEVLKEALK